MEIEILDKKIEIEEGVSIEEVLNRIGVKAIAAEVDGDLKDLSAKLNKSVRIKPIYLDSEQGKEILNHSAAHILANAVKDLYKVKLAIGPVTRKLPGPEAIGFYYDFYREEPFSQKDLEKIEKRARELIKKGLKFQRIELSNVEAKKKFKDNQFKLELLEEMKDLVSLYKQNGFFDLCKGPHLPNSKFIKAFKILGSSSAYWKGKEENPVLQRIYGIAFASQAELTQYLHLKEEAEKRDHIKLGKKLGLFMIEPEFGPGLILWKPKGAIIRKEIMEFALNTYLKWGYLPVYTPHIAHLAIWKRSGHWKFYRENMYSPIEIEKEKYMLKPMNCPGHVKIYNSEVRSYKDLPLRYTEMGTVYRYEKSGVLHGLTRVRGFTQDDAHIFCTPEQLRSEILNAIDLTYYILNTFGFKEFEVSLSVRGPDKEKYLGDDKIWEIAEKALEDALKKKKLSYKRYPGEAVFYGPKIDFLVKDALGRKWQLTTIQVDFNFPQKFKMEYIGKDGKKHTPVMIHRALLGSLERFIGILIEHYAGNFPVWLAPVQVKIIPITDRNNEYAKEIEQELRENKIRVEGDYRDKTLEYKIRDAQLEKIPYMLIVGDEEQKNKTISIRKRTEEVEHGLKLKEFIREIRDKIEKRSLKI